MGFGSGKRTPRVGRRILVFLALLIAALLASLYLIYPTEVSKMGDTAVLTDNGAAVDSQVALPEGAVTENIVSPMAPGDSPAEDAADGNVLALRPPDPTGETATGITLAGGQMVSARFADVPGDQKDSDVPVFITGSITPPPGANPVEQSIAFFDVNKDVFQMSSPGAELALKRQVGDQVGMTHVHMSQQYKGVPVFGADMAVHFSADGKIAAVNGHYVPGISLDVTPVVSTDAAVESAQRDLGYAAPASSFEPPLLTVLAPAGKPARLTWKVVLAADGPPLRMVYFVDAHTGEIAGKYDALEDARNRKTYTANNGTSLPGTLLISEGGSSGDSVAQAAHNNAGATYDYYFNTFGRDSFNNAGATITSTVHYSSNYNNAFWNGQQVVYGDGDGNVFSPLGNAKDVVAHEITHAVTQYTASLVYSYQSGALNESYSDVFGAMVDRDDWLMGEDVYTPGTPGDALRSLSNPPAYGQPDHMNNYVNTDSDNGGVHTNSGIPNKAAYNVAQAIGKDKMERVWYRSLTLYLNSGSQFSDARDASVQAAIDLYGAGSAEVTAVQNGFSAVGIGGTTQSDTTARIEIDHSYRGDLVVTLGVGDPNSPTWSTTVSNRYGGSADNIYTTVDIAPGAGYLPPSWQNRWFLKVYDAAQYDTGSISKFTITDHGTTYTATDVPIAINDFTTSISYIPTVDNVPPTVASTGPASGGNEYINSNISATFSEPMNAATITSSSFTLKRDSDGATIPATVSYDSNTRSAILDPVSNLSYSTSYTATVTNAVTDTAGNAMAQNYSWSFSTWPPPKNYYFTWYDMVSVGMRDWLLMGNPSSSSSFNIFVDGLSANASPIVTSPNRTQAVTYPGMMGGPVRMEARDGKSSIISKRTLYGDSLEEINGLEESRLDSHYYFTWYDYLSPGSRNWVLVANPGGTSVAADIYIAGRKMNSSPYVIAPGTSVTPIYPGVMGGPVEVIAYEPGNPSAPRDVIATQRVLWNANFNEAIGIPASELSNDYLFTWYDHAGARTWVLVANPDPNQTLAVEITMGGRRMTDASGNPFFLVGPGGSIAPTFPGVMLGPVEVKGYNAASYNPSNPGSPNMNFYTSERSLFGDSFGEINGFSRDRLSSQYFFTWYDQLSAGSRNWVLVTNPGSGNVAAEVWIAGQRVAILNIAPGQSQTPTFPGVMNGPVEVRGYDLATYNPNNPGTPNREVFTSQRVLWQGHFNEVEGMVLQ